MKYYEKIPSDEGNTSVNAKDLTESESTGISVSRNNSPLKIDDESLVSLLISFFLFRRNYTVHGQVIGMESVYFYNFLIDYVL